MRRLFVLAAATLAAVGVLAPAPSVGAAEPFCGITWGSLAKSDPALSTASMSNIRAGRHECWDRLVFDLGPPDVVFPGQAVGYMVSYVPVVTDDGTGDPVPLAGGAFLQVTINAPAYDLNTGLPTYSPPDRFHAVNVTGYQTFRQVYFGGTFEGYTTVGLGVRARLPFRVFTLAGPGNGSRLVIDVAHRW
ncbi:MAG TPA: hypothetical protein VFB94_10230 [Acidimicrobiales bacterium]|nr:hypothetical protein [Acidimicrobiales bacterium]